MFRIVTSLSLFALALFPTLSHAETGPGSGGGGNVIRCADSVELLDYYEAREMQNVAINLGGPELTVQQKVELAIQRASVHDTQLTTDLRELAKEFFRYSAWITGADLPPIADSNHILIPRGCDVVQTAIQKERRFVGESIYYINKELWDRMSRDHQAGLVLHEILYRRARINGATDSVGARYFNSMLASEDRIRNLTLKEFVSLLKSTLVGRLTLTSQPFIRFRGNLIVPVSFWPNGTLQSGLFASADAPVMIQGNPYNVQIATGNERSGWNFSLFENGTFSVVSLNGNENSAPLYISFKDEKGSVTQARVKVEKTYVELGTDGSLILADLVDFKRGTYGIIEILVDEKTREARYAKLTEDSKRISTNHPKVKFLDFNENVYCSKESGFTYRHSITMVGERTWKMAPGLKVDLAGTAAEERLKSSDFTGPLLRGYWQYCGKPKASPDTHKGSFGRREF